MFHKIMEGVTVNSIAMNPKVLIIIQSLCSCSKFTGTFQRILLCSSVLPLTSTKRENQPKPNSIHVFFYWIPNTCICLLATSWRKQLLCGDSLGTCILTAPVFLGFSSALAVLQSPSNALQYQHKHCPNLTVPSHPLPSCLVVTSPWQQIQHAVNHAGLTRGRSIQIKAS